MPTTPRPERLAVERRGLRRRGGDGGSGQSEYRGPGAPTGERKVALGSPDRRSASSSCSCSSSSGRSRAGSRSRAVSPTRTSGSTRTRRLALDLSGRAGALPLDDDPDARHRQRAKLASRAGDMHSDSILLLRTDPSHHRLYYLSIPRDLQVPIPGAGDAEDQRRVPDRWPGARDQDDQAVHGPRDRPRDGRSTSPTSKT